MDASLNLVESYSDLEAFMRWLGERRTWLAVDTETGGLDWWRNDLRLVQIGDPNTGWALAWDDYAGVVKEVLRDYQGPMVMHNAKFDVHFLEHNGVQLNRHNLHDTRAMAHILHPDEPSGLKFVGDRYIHSGSSQGDKELKLIMNKQGWGWDTIPTNIPQYWQYACLDVVLTSRIAELFYPPIYNSYKKLYETEVWTALTLTDMERRGIQVDVGFCREWAAHISQWEKSMEMWFRDSYGIENPGSTQQVANAIMKEGVPLNERTPTGKYSMTEEVLAGIDHPIAQNVLAYRDQVKIRSTYLDGFIDFADSDGLLHASINPLGARTGRMSASRPNLQNVPRSWVRSAFVPRPGNKLLLVDFDQIELRLMAHYAGDQNLIQAVLDGDDLHSFVGRMVYNQPEITRQQRQIVKHANFAKIYGAGAQQFAKTAGITLDEARLFNSKYDQAFVPVKNWIRKISTIGDTQGYIDTPYLGRRQVVGKKGQGYKLVNYFIQGTAADVLKRKIVELSMTDAEQFMLIPIHDEIAFDVPEDLVEDVKREVMTVMQDLDTFSVPLTVGAEVVDRWGDKYV